MIKGAKFVGEGRLKIAEVVTQVVAIGKTSRWVNVA